MSPSLGALARYFFYLGATCFGGVAVQIESIRKDLVEERGWLGREEFLRGVAFSYLSPGPVGSQLVVYAGRIKAGWAGAAVCLLACGLAGLALRP